MKRKILIPILTLAVILTAAFVVQPEIAKVSANLGDLLIYNRLCPVGDVYRYDTIIFGGTIHNNDTRNFLLTEMRANFYAEGNRSEIIHFYEYLFQHEVTRDELPPGLSRTISFQATIEEELDIENNYTVMLIVSYYEEGTEVAPWTRQIGSNATINILLRRIDAPNYIWAVMVLLSIGILAFVVVGLVGWIRERRARQ
ncbi:MAG: hypothetical protein KGD59_05700 [Candidatus Heimdallarchaeota archaeon]|nr:hypothetical protein [Candidatus Heimdallarchaeota archaeon]MBY8994026.1 hypothetical protein [Candidatus Heimdallarchaeota archaeon]